MNPSDDPRLQLLLRLLDSAPLVMWAQDKEGRFTMSAGSGLAALGSKPGEWVGRDGLAEWRGTAAEAAMRRALAGEEFSSSLSIPGPRHYQVWYMPIRDVAGQPNGTYGLALDVTAEREREEELRARLAELQAQKEKTDLFGRVVNAAPVTVWAMDKEGKILLSEGGVLPRIGLKPGEAVGLNAFDMYKGTAIEGQIRLTLQGQSASTTHEISPGVSLDTWSIPLTNAEGIEGVVGIGIDSSERIKSERELREKLQLIERQAATIRALATPIIRVWDEVLCLPVIGTVDSQRTAEMMSALLHAISREQARFAVVDLTGVDVVDTSTADHLIRLFKAARVLGVEGVLCGIQPAVAQTIVALGMDLGEVHTKRTLQDALKWCLARRAAADAAQNGAPAASPIDVVSAGRAG